MGYKQKLLKITPILLLIAFILSAGQPAKSLPPECTGDLDNDYDVDVGDAVYLVWYIFSDGPAPDPIEASDLDECGSINITDFSILTNYMYNLDILFPCEYSGDCYHQLAGNQVVMGCPLEIVNPSDELIPLPIYINNSIALSALLVGLHYSSDDIEVMSVDYTGSILPPSIFVLTDKVVPAENKVLLAWKSFDYDGLLPQSGGLLAILYIQVQSGAPQQEIDFTIAFVEPAGETIFSPYGGGSIIPEFIDCGTADAIISYIICGNVNGDELVNILDIVYLINYKYKQGPAPDPIESGDVNSLDQPDGLINILDIVYLINYKYKDGPEPVCPQS